MSKNLKLKSIGDILKEDFYIPDYQRGYRWTNQQVVDLLDDILEFSKSENNGFYCLQPIVVKKNKDTKNRWDVIDGQQRLTTVKIILTYFNDRFTEEYRKKIYALSYKTRENSEKFLKNINKEEHKDNIDYFHIYKAYETIKNWFSDKQHIINEIESIVLNKVKIIWYEVLQEDSQSDIDIFTRINMGKIPLTNSELIKAMLLNNLQNNKKDKNNKKFELASHWDQIEYSLQYDDFWLFLNIESDKRPTRIDFIFDIMAYEYLNKEENKEFEETLNKSTDPYYTYHIVNYKLLNGMSAKDLWEEVQNTFRILNEWYENREFFHKIGFLLSKYNDEKSKNNDDMINVVIKFISEYQKDTKTEFIAYLDEQIVNTFKIRNKKDEKLINIDELDYEKHGKIIKQVLLMFNIQTILSNKDSDTRFSFDRYKKDNWDIEHIRSQTDKIPSNTDEKEEWINDILPLYKEKSKEELLDISPKDFESFFKEVQKKLEGLENSKDPDFDTHCIGNLALLDSNTNRSYRNAFFPVKRKIIIQNDMNGTFVPICTKNLFMKYYTKSPDHLQVWTNKDAKDYQKHIRVCFKKMFLKGAKQ